jgi:hypothetical protein
MITASLTNTATDCRAEPVAAIAERAGFRPHVFIAVYGPTLAFPRLSREADTVERRTHSNEYDNVIY